MTRLSEDEIKAIDEEQKHVRSQWGDNRTLKNCRALLADREAILAELDAAEADNEHLQAYRKAYLHAIECVDQVFQVCNEIPEPILPDFCRPGDDKFEAVKELATTYKESQAELAAVKTELAEVQSRYEALLVQLEDVVDICPFCDGRGHDKHGPCITCGGCGKVVSI